VSERLALVVVAAGSSSRMGGIDKVWAPLHGEPVIYHSLRALGPEAGRVVVVIRPDGLERARDELPSVYPGVVVVPGGAERSDSVFNGLQEVAEFPLVAVHDAARPLASAHLVYRGVALLGGSDGAIPVLPVLDTVKRVDNGVIVETLDRSTLRLAQTPQLFRTAALLEAHTRMRGRPLTDDASAFEAVGKPVRVYPGERWNLKITTSDDLAFAEMVIDRYPAV
jgi:2-C-methyl-D-erythritol 4-phosphate cytidylyltransferase